MEEINIKKANLKTHQAWEDNADYWDEYMAEGNDFVEVLCWPAMQSLMDIPPGSRILDIACGNGLTSRRLAELGFKVDAFDFSKKMIEKAKQRTKTNVDRIRYHVIDATDEKALLELGKGKYDGAFSNMALFDMAEINPLFQALSELLRPGSPFVFSITHPCFNNPNTVMVAEEEDRSGEMVMDYSIRINRYLTPRVDFAVALRQQPKPQLVFHRPLQQTLKSGFEADFVLDAFEERAFPKDHPPGHSPLSWGANFSEIPPILIARMRKKSG